MSPEQEIEKLRERIRYHDRKYHIDATPEISDLEYGKVIRRLKPLERTHPTLVTPDSPTQRVGGEPIERVHTVPHARPMFSIDNTYDTAVLRKWASRAYEATDPQLLAIAEELKAARKGTGKLYEEKRRELREK